MLSLFFIVVATLFAVSRGDGVHNFCAEISSSSASGISGYYALQIDGGYAYHAYSLDMSSSSVDTSLCTYSGSTYLSYSLQSSWLLSGTSSSSSMCSSTVTMTNANNGQLYYLPVLGGHYDPYLSCSIYSQYYIAQGQQGGGGGGAQATNYCNMLKRMPAQNNNNQQGQVSYTYACNSTGFIDQGLLNTCEVGDFSGKFGPATSSSRVFTSSKVLVDPLPPLSSNFLSPTKLSLPWSSISFTCGQTVPVACAAFTKVSDVSSSPCASAFAEISTVTSPAAAVSEPASVSEGISTAEFDAAIACSVIFCLIGGILVGAVGMYYWSKRQVENSLLAGAKTGDYARFA